MKVRPDMVLNPDQASIIILTLAVVIVGLHLGICVFVWRRFSPLRSCVLVFGISLLVSFLWFFTGALMQLLFLWSSDARGVQHDTYFATFNLLIYPCERIVQLSALFGPGFCDGREPYLHIFRTAVFFLLGLAVAPVALIGHQPIRPGNT